MHTHAINTHSYSQEPSSSRCQCFAHYRSTHLTGICVCVCVCVSLHLRGMYDLRTAAVRTSQVHVCVWCAPCEDTHLTSAYVYVCVFPGGTIDMPAHTYTHTHTNTYFDAMYRSIKIILPFFPVGTMERVDIEGEIATARTLARILSNVPPCRCESCMYVCVYVLTHIFEEAGPWILSLSFSLSL